MCAVHRYFPLGFTGPDYHPGVLSSTVVSSKTQRSGVERWFGRRTGAPIGSTRRHTCAGGPFLSPNENPSTSKQQLCHIATFPAANAMATNSPPHRSAFKLSTKPRRAANLQGIYLQDEWKVLDNFTITTALVADESADMPSEAS